jgi:DNA helicase-2/ATP-dependent DNA helicase PcrA
MEHGVFPHQRSMTDAKELAEERRLAYVGLTRARERLYLTRAEQRSLWGQSQYNPASQFLDEIPSHLLEWKREGSMSSGWGSGSGTVNFATSRYDRGSHWAAGTSSNAISRGHNAAPVAKQRVQQNKEIVVPKVGQNVKHSGFGLGVVIAIEGAGDKTVAKVQFVDSEKRLLLRYAPLEIVE